MIQKENYGSHEDVIVAKFGYGSIKMSNAIIDIEKETFHDIIFRSDFTGRKTGDIEVEPDVKYADDIEHIDFVLRFKSIEGIQSLINRLQEARKNIEDGLTQSSFLLNNK